MVEMVADVTSSCGDGCGDREGRRIDETGNAVRVITAAIGIRWGRRQTPQGIIQENL